MALWQGKSNRKPTGGRLVANQGKRKFEIGREKQFTRIGEQSLKQYRGAGGSVKVGMLSAQYANVVDKKTNTVKKVKILTVKSNPADKGATITTEIGDAIVTSRPGQDGAINAVLLE